MSGEPARENRLAREKSPYLLQHARNPVDWYPWGEEAFERARRDDKPIFLSIGYSTCHWCHVMERESFESEEIAAILNEHFVAVKVDREERPDVDHVYMTVCQALTGSGGWPLTLFLTPEKEPFFAGTYFPPATRFGRPGLREVLFQVASAWEGQRDKVLDAATRIAAAVGEQLGAAESAGDAAPGQEALHLGFEQLLGRFDEEHAGFGSAPKFPTPHQLSFLLRWWKRSGDGRALDMVERTLHAMRRGGIYDHVGFGFHRYSTDREWKVPHFEKMLYDQALLTLAYIECAQATGSRFYAAVAREIVTYVVRDLTGPEGGFLSAEDADSEGEEGKFYVWTAAEIREALGAEEAAIAEAAFSVEAGGNWIDPAHGGRPGTNILHVAGDPREIAERFGLEPAELGVRLDQARQKLLAARSSRVRPHRDDKVLTSWNGLMIAAAARTAQVLGEPAFAEAAAKAAFFVLDRLRREDGRLLARWRDGEAAHPGYLDDYAFFIWGLLELYEATFEPTFLADAMLLADAMEELFADAAGGGYFFTGTDGEPLLARAKEIYDGAMPSGNSVAALVLLKLARFTGDSVHEGRAERLFRAFAKSAERVPSAHAQLLAALDFAIGPTREIVLAAERNDPRVAALLVAVRRPFVPNKVVLLRPAAGDGGPLRDLAPYVEGQTARDGAPTAYVCEGFACKEPVTDPAALAALLA
ncbi:MAG TPA: thioredoxin domain-containing protein [Candidatus Eisenbacteria bacterium]|nr:thioredoxin domain-containing protein [Candidatus Eisenbacteria bacterium]